jgi:hypothetical protein
MPSERQSAELLGAEITELCSYIYAAEHRLLTLLRAFDAVRLFSFYRVDG